MPSHATQRREQALEEAAEMTRHNGNHPNGALTEFFKFLCGRGKPLHPGASRDGG
jgi:hypothetical protein